MSRDIHDPPLERVTCLICGQVLVTPWPDRAWAQHWKRRHMKEGQR